MGLSLMNMLGFSSSLRIAHTACYLMEDRSVSEIAAGVRQHSHSSLQSPWDKWPRLLLSSRGVRVSKWGLLFDEGGVGVSMLAKDHILLSQIPDSPNLVGQVPVFVSPRNRVTQLYSQALGPLFVVFYDSQGYGGGLRTCLHTGINQC
jgi:hypothetical protein